MFTIADQSEQCQLISDHNKTNWVSFEGGFNFWVQIHLKVSNLLSNTNCMKCF